MCRGHGHVCRVLLAPFLVFYCFLFFVDSLEHDARASRGDRSVGLGLTLARMRVKMGKGTQGCLFVLPFSGHEVEGKKAGQQRMILEVVV